MGHTALYFSAVKRRTFESLAVDLQKKIAKEYQSGETMVVLSVRHQISVPSVRDMLVKAGVEIRKKGGTRNQDPKRAEKMAKLYREGATLADIGKQFGLTRERVRQILRKHGVESLGRRDTENSPRPLTREQKAIAKDYENGLPPHEMFEKYPGLTATRMWGILRKAGVKGKPKGYYVRRPDYERVAKGVVEDYQKGMECADIANKYDLCGKTEIYKFLQRAGVPVRNPIGKKPELTQEEKDIARLYDSGMRPAELMEKYPGLDYYKLQTILRRTGTPRKPRGFHPSRKG